jgi:hypothetical protein
MEVLGSTRMQAEISLPVWPRWTNSERPGRSRDEEYRDRRTKILDSL